MQEPLLRTEELTKSFGGLMAISGVNFELFKGDIHAIIGPNGAGKTTFFNLVSGFIRPDTGAIYYKGEEITDLPRHKICHIGMLRSFQVAAIYPMLTALENIKIAIFSREKMIYKFLMSAEKANNEEAYEILEWVGLGNEAFTEAGTLSHGDRKCLELAIVLANKPELILLDEPTAGMSKEETKRAMELVEKIAHDRNVTILFTEHDMYVVFGIAKRVTVLHLGGIIVQGKPEEMKKNEKVRKIYLGEK